MNYHGLKIGDCFHHTNDTFNYYYIVINNENKCIRITSGGEYFIGNYPIEVVSLDQALLKCKVPNIPSWVLPYLPEFIFEYEDVVNGV